MQQNIINHSFWNVDILPFCIIFQMIKVKCIELYSVCDGSKDCFFGGDEGNKLCTESFCKNVLGGRWKCPYEAKCIFKFQVCKKKYHWSIVFKLFKLSFTKPKSNSLFM